MSDEEDDFVTYGTALDPLDEENLPRKKPVTVEDQFALDAQGRRRFHGAFTGGFSAGYFNSVGTRDGWRPQQFKSSRSSKAGNVLQRPEDFMDEEDTGEFGIAPTAIRAAKEYSDETHKGKKRERARQESSGPIPGTPVLKELLQPAKERVGAMLLKKMGWKPGQGIGPRLTKKEKKQKKQQRGKVKVYGCSMPNQQEKLSESESESSGDEYSYITFAPDDFEPYRCNPKDNYFGIGYTGLDRRPILNQHINLFDAPTFSLQEKNKKLSIRGQAFGVGAFEAEDDDIYAREDMSRYDFALVPERKSKSRWSKGERPKTGCIEGFIPAKEQLRPKKVFAVPALPNNYVPVHKVRKSRFSPRDDEKSYVQKRHEINAESRAKIINDNRPSIINSKDSEPKNSSVAAKIITHSLNLHGKEKTAERQKLEQNMQKKTPMSWLDKLSSTTFVRGETIGKDPKIQGSLQDASTFSKETEKKAFEDTTLTRPSFADLNKQQRFEQYMKFSESERKFKFSSVQPLSMTEWERDQEAQEFEKAAHLCERIDYVSASGIENEKNEHNIEVDLNSLSLEGRMTAAAKMKKFGKLTRICIEWKPVKLVCVRFNIAEPLVGVAEEGKKRKKFSIFDSLAWGEVAHSGKFEKATYEDEPMPSTSSSSYTSQVTDQRTKNFGGESSTSIKSKSDKEKSFEECYDRIFGKRTESESPGIQEVKIEKDARKAEEPTARMNVQEKKDLYKSIFLSSDESESESEEANPVDDEKLKAALIGKSAMELNAQRNTSPPRGIFAKLDLDNLMKRPEKTDASRKEAQDREKESNEAEKEDETEGNSDSKDGEQDPTVKMEEEDVYGPILPEALPNDSSSRKTVPALSIKIDAKLNEDGAWIEKSRDKKKSKKEKKKHKHKERSRSKSRKKSKKEKRH